VAGFSAAVDTPGSACLVTLLDGPLLQPEPCRIYLRLSGRCVSADAAAVFAALEALGLRSTFDAAVAAFALVTSLFDFLPFGIRSSFFE
jgi:hypothetical protein